MATVVNKTTFQVLKSVNTPDYPTSDWLHNPAGLAALLSVPVRYWKLNVGGTDLEEMSTSEKAAVDSGSLLTTVRQEHRGKLFDAARDYIESRYNHELREYLMILYVQAQGSMPNRQAIVKTYLDYMQSVLAELLVRRNAVNSASTVPAVLAVSIDFSSFNGSDPGVSIFQVLTETT